jgi:hypothetical protein
MVSVPKNIEYGPFLQGCSPTHHLLLWTHELGSCHPDGTLANLSSMEVLGSPNSHDLMLKCFPSMKQPKGS